MQSLPEAEKPTVDWQRVDMNYITPGRARTNGGESLGYGAFEQSGFPPCVGHLGLNSEQIQRAAPKIRL